MTIAKAREQLRLPNPATQEGLEERWETVLTYGDKVIMAGYYYTGIGCTNYFAAIYEHLDDDTSAEGLLGLQAVSEVEHEDNGHAIAWAIAHTWLRK